MNLIILMGRLTRDPEIRYSGDTAIAHYRLAVDRRFKKEGQPDADFFDCVCFGKQAEFVEKYLHQGTKMVIQGRLQNDNYQDKDGKMVYRNQIMIDSQEFAESKNASASGQITSTKQTQGRPKTDEFINVPDGIQEELPFN